MSLWVWLLSFLDQNVISYVFVSSNSPGTWKADRPEDPWHPERSGRIISMARESPMSLFIP